MHGLHGELRRLGMKPAPMPQGPRHVEEPAKVEPFARIVKVFNAGSDAERKFAENAAVVVKAWRNGLITEDKARDLIARL